MHGLLIVAAINAAHGAILLDYVEEIDIIV